MSSGDKCMAQYIALWSLIAWNASFGALPIGAIIDRSPRRSIISKSNLPVIKNLYVKYNQPAVCYRVKIFEKGIIISAAYGRRSVGIVSERLRIIIGRSHESFAQHDTMSASSSSSAAAEAFFSASEHHLMPPRCVGDGQFLTSPQRAPVEMFRFEINSIAKGRPRSLVWNITDILFACSLFAMFYNKRSLLLCILWCINMIMFCIYLCFSL